MQLTIPTPGTLHSGPQIFSGFLRVLGYANECLYIYSTPHQSSRVHKSPLIFSLFNRLLYVFSLCEHISRFVNRLPFISKRALFEYVPLCLTYNNIKNYKNTMILLRLT